MPKYKLWELDDKEIAIRDFVKHPEDYPVDKILLVPQLTPGKGAFLEEITLDQLKKSEYLNDKGTFEIEEHDDGCDEDGTPIILRYLWLCIRKHQD